MIRPLHLLHGLRGLRVGVLVLLLAAGLGMAAERPTLEQWTPIQKALDAHAITAEAQVKSCTAAFPQWGDGFRALASEQLYRHEYAECLTAARRALALAPSDASAAVLAIDAYAGLGQTREALAVAERFDSSTDPTGKVNFAAARAAVAGNDPNQAGLFLSLALARNQSPPAEYLFLDARIAEDAGDFSHSLVSLRRATTINPDFGDAWYQMGAMQMRIAPTQSDQTLSLLAQAEASFSRASALLENEPVVWLGLGSAQLQQAELQNADTSADAWTKASEAATSLRKSIALKEDQRDAQLDLGQALLFTGKNSEAIEHFLRARELGASNRTLDFNLLLAYDRAQRFADFQNALAQLVPVSINEHLVAGIGEFDAGQYAAACQHLEAASRKLDPAHDRLRLERVERYLGHAQKAQADELAHHDDGDKLPQGLSVEIDQHLNAAADAYRQAGDLGDRQARMHFLALQTNRSSKLGYEAGWQYLDWDGLASVSGWSAVIGNYADAIVDGHGLSGIWDHHPMHVVVWGLLAVLPICFGLMGWLRARNPPPVEYREELPARTANRTANPASRTALPQTPPIGSKVKRTTPVPVSKPALAPKPAATPKPVSAPKPAPAAKAVPTPVVGNHPGKAETEQAITMSHQPTAARITDAAGVSNALERRTPKPDLTPPRRPPVR